MKIHICNDNKEFPFLYVDDCAEAIKLSLEKDVPPEPINIGTGGEIKIKYLAHTIASETPLHHT